MVFPRIYLFILLRFNEVTAKNSGQKLDNVNRTPSSTGQWQVSATKKIPSQKYAILVFSQKIFYIDQISSKIQQEAETLTLYLPKLCADTSWLRSGTEPTENAPPRCLNNFYLRFPTSCSGLVPIFFGFFFSFVFGKCQPTVEDVTTAAKTFGSSFENVR